MALKIQKVEDGDLTANPVFVQIEKRLEDVRRRAFELFEESGCVPGHELGDWLKAEREVLGWPPVEAREDDSKFQFQVPLDDFDISQVDVVVTPLEILVHAKTQAERDTEHADALRSGLSSQEVFRRIGLRQRIEVDQTQR